MTSQGSTPTEASAGTEAPVTVDLDVRSYHARGEEPFAAIMAAVGRVPVGQAFRLRNTFEPFPLYTVLGQRGFTHTARQLGADDWEILFVRSAEGPLPKAEAAPAPTPAPVAEEQPAEIVQIDVSDLVPPEPMVRILEAAQRLQPGQMLLVEHQRRPVYLYPRLEELGYTHETRELAANRIEIRIRKPAAS